MVRYSGYDKRSEVVTWTQWKNKNCKLPNVAGVYIFADSNKNVRYVGKAGAGRLNLEARNAMKVRDKAKGASIVKVLITNSDSKAKALERYLIKKYD